MSWSPVRALQSRVRCLTIYRLITTGVALVLLIGATSGTLVTRYLENVRATDRGMLGRVFHVLHWTQRELDSTLAALVAKGIACEIVDEDQRSQLVMA